MTPPSDSNAGYRPLALWSIPRSLSHAFEKMIRARNDHTVFAEPFNDPWYFGPERQTHREYEIDPTITYESRFTPILNAAIEGKVFIRDQPWHLGKKYLNKETLTLFQSSILIRDPSYSLPSLFKIKPDFREEEAGYIALVEAYKILLEAGENVPIIDAYDIQCNPEETINAWCDAVGIPRNVAALNWERGSYGSWENWKQFNDTVTQSTGFLPPSEPPKVTNEHLAKMIDSLRKYYRELEIAKILI